MTTRLSFPCEARFAAALQAAVMAAARASGLDAGRVAAALDAVGAFFDGCVQACSTEAVAVEVSESQIVLRGAGRGLTLDL